jgi:propanol-preferring alcohol dehydrogenase
MVALRMVLDSPRPVTEAPLRSETFETSPIGVGELGLTVRACAICRTDLQIAEGDLPARHLPIVPGHQIVGTVDAVGDGVEGWRIGDRAAVGWLAWACGSCAQCTSGRENLCEKARFTGWDVDGGYATRAVVAADFAFRVPETADDVDFAPLLCGGVIGYRSLRRAGVKPGHRVGLYGFGASALLALQIARHWGCRVFVATRSGTERARALEMGAEWAGGYADRPPEPLDAAVTFAPSGDVVVAALAVTAPGATVAINAIHLDRIPQFSYDLLWRERNLVSVANYTRDDAKSLLRIAAEIPLRTRFDRFALTDANVALERLRAGKLAGSAVLVT